MTQQLNMFSDAPNMVAPSIDEIKRAYSQRRQPRVFVCDNFWHTYEGDYPYFKFEEGLIAGRNYLVGDDSVPMSQFIKEHRSPCSKWQGLAYLWAKANPDKKLVVDTPTMSWEVYTRGEYVEFALPHHDAGGERHYISENGKSKILVNVD